jgi:hypothetical protein
MKTEEEFKRYYESEVLESLRELESSRKKTLLKLVAFIFFMLAAAVFIAVALWAAITFNSEFLVCCLFILPLAWLFGLAFGLGKIKNSYVKAYKGEVMPKIIRFIDEGLQYSYQGGIGSSDFIRSGIFLTYPDQYSCEDHVFGTVDKTAISFSEVHAKEKREHQDREGRKRTEYITIFRGIFFVADFNKSFRHKTLVLPDKAERLFGKMIGGFLQSKNISRPQLVKMEDPEFEKYFVVYSQDQVEARYILSTSLMQRITEFKKKTGKNIYFSFVDDKLMAAIPYKKDLFEPRLIRSILDEKQVMEHYKTLHLIIGIVHELNLNTRIWSKK